MLFQELGLARNIPDARLERRYPFAWTPLALIGSLLLSVIIIICLIVSLSAFRRQRLYQALNMRSITAVKLWIRLGGDVNSRSRIGFTPLAIAISKQDLAFTRELLWRGARPDVSATGGLSPLMGAAGNGDVPAMRLLIRYGATIDRVTAGGTTALVRAASSGNLDAIKLLCERGANVNVVPMVYGPPLHEAVAAGNLDAVRLLLQFGSDPFLKDHRGRDATSYLSECGITPAALSEVMALFQRKPASMATSDARVKNSR